MSATKKNRKRELLYMFNIETTIERVRESDTIKKKENTRK